MSDVERSSAWQHRLDCEPFVLDLRSDGSLPTEDHPFSGKVKKELYIILDITDTRVLEQLFYGGVITRSEYQKVCGVTNVQQRREDIIELLYKNKDHNFRLRIAEVLRDPKLGTSHVAEYIERNGDRPKGQTDWPFYAEDKSIDKLQIVFIEKRLDVEKLLPSLLARGVLKEMQAAYVTKEERPSDQIRALMEIVVCFSIAQLEQFASCLDEMQPELAKPLVQIVKNLTA